MLGKQVVANVDDLVTNVLNAFAARDRFDNKIVLAKVDGESRVQC